MSRVLARLTRFQRVIEQIAEGRNETQADQAQIRAQGQHNAQCRQQARRNGDTVRIIEALSGHEDRGERKEKKLNSDAQSENPDGGLDPVGPAQELSRR